MIPLSQPDARALRAFRNPALCLLGTALSLSAQTLSTPIPTASPASATPGDTVVFSVQNPAGAGTLYHWDFGDSAASDTSATPIAKHAYSQLGRFVARVYADSGAETRNAAMVFLVHRPLPAHLPASSSFLAMDAAGKKLFVSNTDHHSVSALDLDGLRRLWEMPAGKSPATLAVAPDSTVWVACRGDDAVHILRPDNGIEIARIDLPYGSKPFGLAFDPTGNGKAFLTLQGSGRVVRLNASSRAVESGLDVGPQPRHLTVTPDGSAGFTARFISPQTEGEVIHIDFRALSVIRRIALAEDPGPDRENAGRGIPNYLEGLALSPDGTRLWIPSSKTNVNGSKFADPNFKVFQNSVRAMACVVDAATGQEAGPRFDFDDTEGPAAVAFAPLGDPVFVAFRGSNKVQALDPWRNGLSFTLAKTGLLPDALLIDAGRGRLYVHAALTREVRVYDVAGALTFRNNAADSIAVIATTGQEALAAPVLRGKQIFHNASDPRMSQDGYLSCGACHFEGGSDNRVWDFTARGEGLRRTIPLAVRAGTHHGPVHWSANFDEIQDFEHDIRGPFGGIGFLDSATFHSGNRDTPLGGKKAGASAELDALAAYLASLTEGSRSPFRNADGTATSDAVAGQAVFMRADVGCARCHTPPYYTDSRLPPDGTPVPPDPPADSLFKDRGYYTAQGFLVHDVGTFSATSGHRLGDTLKGFDTPTLIDVFSGGPYLHDGSAATLLDVITAANPLDRHGRTSQLTSTEKNQLVAFLVSLDREDNPNGIFPRKISQAGSTPKLVLDRRLGGSPRVFWQPLEPSRSVWADLNGRVSQRPPLDLARTTAKPGSR